MWNIAHISQKSMHNQLLSPKSFYNTNNIRNEHNIKTNLSWWRENMSYRWLVIGQLSVLFWLEGPAVILRLIGSGRLFQANGPLIENFRFPNCWQDRTRMKSLPEADDRLRLDKMEKQGVTMEDISYSKYLIRQVVKRILAWNESQWSCWKGGVMWSFG